MLNVGDKVPDFELPLAHADGRKDKVRFSSLLGKGPIVLSFYPLAFTRVCTAQMCDARDSMAALGRLGAQVYGFSCDNAFVNAQFAKHEGLAFGLFSDANHDVVESLWATQEVAGVRHAPKRGWLVVTPEGTVAEKWVTDVPGAPWPGNGPIEAALQKLHA
jgi:peroxiredoxin